VTKFKITILLIALLLVFTACNAPATSSSPEQPAEPPAPYPDTPAPVAIDAPIIEAPALVNIQFINELDGWGVTETQIVRTNDGGITWYNVTPPGITEAGYSVDLVVLDKDNSWVQVPDAANYPNSGTLYRTTNGGLAWQLGTTPFNGGDIQFLDANNGWVLADLGVGAGSNAVAVYQTTDGGATWNRTYINDPNNANAGDSLPLGGLKHGLAPLNMVSAWVYGVVYAPGSPYLFVTDNAGQLWVPVSLPLPPGGENAELSIEQIQFVSSNEAFLAMRVSSDTVNLAIYTSSDAGNTWTLTPTLIPIGGSADFLSAMEAVVYNGDQFYVTRDAARTWSIIPPDVNFGETFAGMDFVNPNSGWVITIDPTTNHRSLYRTSDGGATWFPIIE
jgi:photosystem II stability/assembly factor-like uncharacterized protein